MQVRTPGAENCLMYEEIQTKNLSSSAGAFAVTINDGTGTRDDGSGYSLDQIFGNRTDLTYSFPPANCASGTTYTAAVDASRNFTMLFKDSTMVSWEPLPTQSINFAPTAIEAYQVGGFPSGTLMRVENGSGPQAVTSFTPTQAAALLNLSNGTSTQYVQAGANGAPLPSFASNPATPSPGDIWYNTTSNQVEYYNGTSSQPVGGALPNIVAAGTYTKVTVNAQGLTTAGAQITGSDITSGTIGGNAAMNTTGSVVATSTSSTTDSTTNLKVFGGANAVTITAPAGLAANYALQLPPGEPTSSGMVLSSDTSGVLTWANAVSNTGATGYFQNGGNSFGAAATLGTNDNNTLAFKTNGTTDMTILTNGNVGIGTTTPGSLLEVDPNFISLGASNVSGVSGWSTVQPTANQALSGWGSPRVIGVDGGVWIPNTNSNTVNMVVGGSMQAENDGTGSLTNIMGSWIGGYNNGNTTITQNIDGAFLTTANSAGTISMMKSADIYSGVSGGTVSSDIGINIQMTNSGGTIQNRYGIYMISPSGTATNDYGIYEQGTQSNYFGGNVGIGTTVPATILDINGAESVRGMAAPALSPAGQGRIYFDSTSNQFMVSQNGSAYSPLGTGSAGLSTGGGTMTGELIGDTGTNATPSFGFTGDTSTGFYDSGSHTIGVTNNGTESMTLSSTGITGTGAMNFAAGGTNQALGLNSSGTGSVNVGTGNGTGLSILDPGAATADFVTVKGSTAGNAPVIATAGSDANINLAIMPKGTGNVGIGTTSPTGLLSVGSSSQFQVDSSGNVVAAGAAPGNSGITSGNGIGTLGGVNTAYASSSATIPWPYNGQGRSSTMTATNLQALDSSGAFTQLGTFNTHGNSQQAYIGAISTTGNTVYAPSLVFGHQSNANAGASYSEYMRIDQNGNVGIGTTAPSRNLQIISQSGGNAAPLGMVDVQNWDNTTSHSASIDLMHLGNGGGNTANNSIVGEYKTSIQDSAGTVLNASDVLTTVNNVTNGSVSSNMQFQTAVNSTLTTAMTITGGNVGIGTTNPSLLLTVGSAGGFTVDTNGSVNSNSIFVNDFNAYNYTSTSAGVNFPGLPTLNARNTDTLDNTVAPIVLEVGNTAATNQRAYIGAVSNTAGSSPTIVIGQQTGATAYAERMRIDVSGNVGIGTTVPATILDINGAESVRGMAAPALSPAGQGRIYFDSTSNQFMVSQNGGAYTALGTGSAGLSTGGGTMTGHYWR